MTPKRHKGLVCSVRQLRLFCFDKIKTEWFHQKSLNSAACKAVINLGTSRDTGEFTCDSFRLWWYSQGKQDYPHASSISLLCDGGGSNSCHHYLFKQDLQLLANEIGIAIRVAHYPAYCSK